MLQRTEGAKAWPDKHDINTSTNYLNEKRKNKSTVNKHMFVIDLVTKNPQHLRAYSVCKFISIKYNKY